MGAFICSQSKNTYLDLESTTASSIKATLLAGNRCFDVSGTGRLHPWESDSAPKPATAAQRRRHPDQRRNVEERNRGSDA